MEFTTLCFQNMKDPVDKNIGISLKLLPLFYILRFSWNQTKTPALIKTLNSSDDLLSGTPRSVMQQLNKAFPCLMKIAEFVRPLCVKVSLRPSTMWPTSSHLTKQMSLKKKNECWHIYIWSRFTVKNRLVLIMKISEKNIYHCLWHFLTANHFPFLFKLKKKLYNFHYRSRLFGQ